MECTDRGLVENNLYRLKYDHKNLKPDEPLYIKVPPYCHLSIPVREASRLPTESDNKTLPEVEIV